MDGRSGRGAVAGRVSVNMRGPIVFPGTPEPGTPEPGTPEPGMSKSGTPGSGTPGSGVPEVGRAAVGHAEESARRGAGAVREREERGARPRGRGGRELSGEQEGGDPRRAGEGEEPSGGGGVLRRGRQTEAGSFDGAVR
ncbi:hypothetical protein GCM10027187_43250 [Streptosporangium sandarakinum]